jgi:beta-galactosidase/beta-glucuronidase
MTLPRAEYPRPQFIRSRWLNLNGEWQFEIDQGDSGLERGLLGRELHDRITVPFCPESSLSGINNRDFLNAVWYRRQVTIPEEWAGQRVLLHFQAVDYDTTVWVDGEEVGRHRGGFTPFTCDLGVRAGQILTIVVRARDDHQLPQPRGKQAQKYADYSCWYTRTTGIWQTVWLEPVPVYALKRPRITPDVTRGLFHLEQSITNNRPGLHLSARLCQQTQTITEAECAADLDLTPCLDLLIPEQQRRLWSPQDPYLYDLTIELRDETGAVLDSAQSYAGLRGVALDGRAIKINGQIIFQRLVLDQGYYPDGIMTAPSDEELVRDIQRSMEVGFNGARLHQKVFEERFLYHADRLGYLVWGEFPDWGQLSRVPGKARDYSPTYVAQWLEALERDYSHPAIIGWCGLNETANDNSYERADQITNLDDITRAMFLAAKALDRTRPVLDVSGYVHRVPESDVYDSHDYLSEGDFWEAFEHFKERHAHLGDGQAFENDSTGGGEHVTSVHYKQQPYFISEFGGLWWSIDEQPAEKSMSGWGYGQAPDSLEEFYRRFAALCNTLLDNPHMFGYCYTQLTDVSIEQNGFYTYDRRLKFDAPRLRAIQQRRAAIEE